MTVVETEVDGTWTEPIFTVGEGVIKVGTCSVTDAAETTGVPVMDATAATGVLVTDATAATGGETVGIMAESVLATVTEAEILISSVATSGTKTEG